ncbi:hypothetical protein RRF57_000148 [Xylaria bambusicola]|uniref:Uncharacterized protein n=1 Tax=Xylaria bambusicola TaxID=326684 RepID=A0AAN7UBN1_9PEZI
MSFSLAQRAREGIMVAGVPLTIAEDWVTPIAYGFAEDRLFWGNALEISCLFTRYEALLDLGFFAAGPFSGNCLDFRFVPEEESCDVDPSSGELGAVEDSALIFALSFFQFDDSSCAISSLKRHGLYAGISAR